VGLSYFHHLASPLPPLSQHHQVPTAILNTASIITTAATTTTTPHYITLPSTCSMRPAVNFIRSCKTKGLFRTPNRLYSLPSSSGNCRARFILFLISTFVF
jgi:hypothetical protein